MIRYLRALMLAVVVLGAGLPSAATPASADQLTFWVKAENDYTTRIEFSSSRNRYWPGDGKSWVIDDYETHKYVLNCRSGEKICYGAWEPETGTRWGVGYQRDRTCSNCCYTCNGNTSTRLIRLTY